MKEFITIVLVYYCGYVLGYFHLVDKLIDFLENKIKDIIKKED